MLLAAGCSSNTSGSAATAQVHLVGSVTIDTANHISVPVYWRGADSASELSRIDATCSGYANSVAVNGQDIHIAGTTYICSSNGTTDTPVAAYWKNGQRTDLERPAAYSQAASEAQQVVVANGSVYVAGYVTGAKGPVPVYWKDGKLVYLTDIPYGATKARASNIAIVGSDVYVSGAILSSDNIPVYWKNGTASVLPAPERYKLNSVPLPIGVSNGAVYLFGHLQRPKTATQADTDEVPVYWKNGELFKVLTSDNDDAYSYGGTVYNGIAYTAGAFVEGIMQTPAVWADKTRRRLSMLDENLYGSAHDVFVDDSGVYVAGYTYTKVANPASIKSVACYWYNGTRVDLPTINNKPAFARELVVTR